jgi:hypothetical protein
MQSTRKKAILVILAVCGAGFLKDGWERSLHAKFQQEGMIAQPLDISQREKIGQTMSIVALGGLRSLVASFINLRAYGSFQDSDWVKLEGEFETMVMLQPKLPYYWETGAWHLSYNAATSSMENMDYGQVRRKLMHKQYVNKGKAFLERGVKNNPENVPLLSSLARFYSTTGKYPNYSKAADLYREAYQTGRSRGYEGRAWLYCLARTADRQDEALLLARRLFENPKYRVDSLLCLLFVLESARSDSPPAKELLSRIFASYKEAQKLLTTYHRNNSDNMPQDGVEYALKLLESEIGLEPPRLLRKPE